MVRNKKSPGLESKGLGLLIVDLLLNRQIAYIFSPFPLLEDGDNNSDLWLSLELEVRKVKG